MANPVLGKSLCSDWFFQDQVRILQYGPFLWKRSNPCIFVLERSRQIQNSEKKLWILSFFTLKYQKKLKRLKFFRNFKDGWRRRTFWSASHRKCILLSETECHIINNLLTELARAVPGNIGPRSFSYGPRCARSLSRRNARVSCNQEKLRHPERALDLKTKDSLVLTKPYCSLANHNPELRCVICTVLHFLLWYFWYYTFLHSCYTFCTPFSANQNLIIFSCILLTWLQADSAPQHLLKGNKGLKSGRQIWPARLHMRNTFDRGVVY